MTRTTKKLLLVSGIFFIIFWFSGILILDTYKKIFIVPTIKRLGDYSPTKLTLNKHSFESETLYLDGIVFNFPFYKEDIQYVKPFFKGKQLQKLGIIFKGENDGAFILFVSPARIGHDDNLMFPKVLNFFLQGKSRFEFEKSTQYSMVKDFSWWNLVYDLRLTFFLTYKSIIGPAFLPNKAYDVQTDYLNGILLESKEKDSRIMSTFMFSLNNKFYTFMLTSQNRELARNIVSTIHSDANVKTNSRYSEELMLISNMSSVGANTEDFKKLLAIMKEKQYSSTTIENIQTEIDRLERK